MVIRREDCNCILITYIPSDSAYSWVQRDDEGEEHEEIAQCSIRTPETCVAQAWLRKKIKNKVEKLQRRKYSHVDIMADRTYACNFSRTGSAREVWKSGSGGWKQNSEMYPRTDSNSSTRRAGKITAIRSKATESNQLSVHKQTQMRELLLAFIIIHTFWFFLLFAPSCAIRRGTGYSERPFSG